MQCLTLTILVDLKKLIDIPGDIDNNGSVAYKLNVIAAKAGSNLKNYIEDLLIKHVEDKNV